MLLNCGVGEDSWESLGLQGDPTNPSSRRSVLNIHWKDWCWSCNLNTLATRCEELTHWRRPWCWEKLKAGGEGDDRGWNGCMASPTHWTWVWVNSRSWWWTGKPGVLQSLGSQRVRHYWATELNWTDLIIPYPFPSSFGCFRGFPFNMMNSVKGLKMNDFIYTLYILYTVRSLHMVFKGSYRKSYESIKFA